VISVVIPAYNSGGVIEKCIHSLLEQTYQQFELIVVNDGSTDNTASVVERLSYTDKRIKLINRPNGGAAAARNSGLKVANGNYIVFVDSDDYVEPRYLEELLKCGDTPETMGIVRMIYEGRALTRLTAESHSYELGSDLADDYFNGHFGSEIAFSASNKLFERQVLINHRITFPENIKIGEDMIFVFRYLCYMKRVTVSAKALYHYVINASSVTLSGNTDYPAEYEKTLNSLRAIDENGVCVGKEVIRRWALEVMTYSLMCPFVTRKSYSDFKAYMYAFYHSMLCRSAASCRIQTDIKRRAIRFCLAHRKTYLLYILIKCNKLIS